MNTSKPFWTSKTLWANAVAFAASLALAFGYDLGLDPEKQGMLIGFIMSLVNIILRLTTTKAIE